MPERGVRPYPPVGDPERLDAIMRRGASMRRRRQLGVGAGAGGAVLAAVFGVVLMVGAADEGDDVIADSSDKTTTTSTTSTTAPLPDTMTVEIDVDTSTVTVIDPEQPDVDDAEQCLSVWVRGGDGQDVAQGYACNGAPGDADATLEVLAVDPLVQITTCATSEVAALPDAPAPPETRPATGEFGIRLPDLAPGTYTLDAQATSGRGDGCPGSSDGSDEIEHEASASPTALVVAP